MSAGTRIALFYAAIFAAGAITSAFLPLCFSDRGLNPAAIGQILSIAALLRVLCGPGWGTAADRIGRRRPVLLAGATLATVAALAYLPLHGFALFAAGRRPAGRRRLGAQPADRLPDARPGARTGAGIRAGPLRRIRGLHDGQRRRRLAPVGRRLRRRPLAAGRRLRRGRPGDAPAAGGPDPPRARSSRSPACACSRCPRSA